MKSNELLFKLSALETVLTSFSFEELKVEEARILKKSFTNFKSGLKNHLFKENLIHLLENAEGSKDHADSLSKNRNMPLSENIFLLLGQVGRKMSFDLNRIIYLAEPLKEQKDAIQRVAGNLLMELEDILEYTDLALGREQVQYTKFNFRNIVHNIFYLCNTLIEREDLKLLISIDENIPPRVGGDPSKLSQVLINLLNNEVARSGPGEIYLYVNHSKELHESDIIEFSIVYQSSIKKNITPPKIDGQYPKGLLGKEIIKEVIKNLGGKIFVFDDTRSNIRFKFQLPFLKECVTGIWPPHLNAPENIEGSSSTSKNFKMKTSTDTGIKNAIIDELGLHLILQDLLRDCLGDFDHLEELVRLYQQNAVEFIGASKLHIQNGDYRQLKHAAHKIKCGLSMLGTKGLYDIVVKMHELSTKKEDVPQLEDLRNRFVEHYMVVEKSIDVTLKKMRKSE